MPLFTVDSNNVFGKYVEEAGTYNVIITNARLYTSNNSNKVISIDYQVLDGKYTGCPIIYADSLTWVDYPEENLTMSIKRFNSLLVACGVKDGVAIDSLEQLASALKGQKLAIEVEWKESSKDGKYYLRVLNHQKLLQDGSQPNGKTRPESGQNSHQSNFGNNRNQSAGYRQQAPQVPNNSFASQADFNAAMPSNGQAQRPQQSQNPQEPNADELPF